MADEPSAGDPARPTSSSRRLLASIVFVVGAASLGAEIAAARLLAPWFGDSTIVWANTIATVLVALSIGYWLGGRLADRDPSITQLARLVLAAALLLALVPFLGEPFLEVSVQALDEVRAGAFVGSLLAVLALVAVPVILLGAVAPFAIRLSIASVQESGTVAGRLYAISTIGSLAGVFASALVLIPFAGTRRTFIAFALALAVVAVLALRRWALVLAPLAIAALLLVPVGTIKAAEGANVIWESETEYQYARVVEQSDGERTLELNEGHAIHSIFRPGQWLTGNYWDEFLVAPLAAGAGPPHRVAILGNAAGTTARTIGHFFPAAEIDAVEIDGEISRAGRELFDMRAPRLKVHTADARPWLRQAAGEYDLIVVDAYHQPYIPFYMATREFFADVREHLAPGGVVAINVGHPEDSDALEQVLTATLAAELPYLARDAVRDVNTILIAARVPLAAAAIARRTGSLPAQLRPLAREFARRLQRPLRGGQIYTDDRAPVEWLIDASLVEVAAEGE